MKNYFKQLKIFNGCSHDVKLYLNPNDFRENRNHQHYLVNQSPRQEDIHNIKQDRMLFVHRNIYDINCSSGAVYQLPEYLTHTIDIPNSYWTYDIIITSSPYGAFAIQKLISNDEFLDRIYIPIPLWDSNPDNNQYAQRIGVCGFKKLGWFSTSPDYYLNMILKGKSPSRFSVDISLDYYRNILNQYSNPYLASSLYNLQSWRNENKGDNNYE